MTNKRTVGPRPATFQDLILALQKYWAAQGCVILQPHDMEMGAGTFNTATFLRAIGPEPWSAAYVQPSRRPTDGRYGENPFRGQHYYQFQVLIKPSPLEIQDLYIGSLMAIGIDPLVHDLRFVEDNWESPTLGAWGLGWEVWLNGMEVTQFTYFQQVGGLDCKPVSGEITYGLERLAMYLQGIESMFELVWTDGPLGRVTYGDVFHQNEVEQSAYNFEHADVAVLLRHFDDHEKACNDLLAAKLALPAYEQVLKASHTFNLLDARRAISVTERQRYILRVRTLARAVAQSYFASREALGLSDAQDIGGMSNADFLVELGTEELPPKALRSLSEAFRDALVSRIDTAGLTHGVVEIFATPRRLAVRVRELARTQPEQKIQRRGPPVTAAFDKSGKPTRAAEAFAQSCGIAIEQLGRETDPKGNECLSYTGVKPGSAAQALLPGFVGEALDELPVPKRMRWGAGDAQFVRPAHWLVLLFGNDVLPAIIFNIGTGNETRGHRFHSEGLLRIASPADYEQVLLEGKVVADFAARRERIRAGVTKLATVQGGRALISDELLDEVTALVEWPVPLAGRFEDRFLQLPRELLISVLQDHQRYFPVEGADGRLLPWFITVSNVDSNDINVVRAGNERVVRPRLSDAAFFWEQDRKAPLATRLPQLDKVTFQAQLGSIGDKVRRITPLAHDIAARIDGDAKLAARAAQLAKCDLVTNLVGEFPELQGIMGRYYAAADGEPAEVATAIAEHYQPRGAGDALPATKSGLAVALADRLDTVTGIFAIGQKPSGTKDPFALRRAAIGVGRMLYEHRLPLDLVDLIDAALRAHTVFESPPPQGRSWPAREAVATDVYDYMMERQRNAWLEPPDGGAPIPGITSEICDAVIATRPRSPLDFDARIRALIGFLALPEAASLTAANKRIVNLLKKSAGGGVIELKIDAALLKAPAEKQLFDALQGVTHSVPEQIAVGEYGAALAALAALRVPVDAFFDDVMVMDPDLALRANRLALLGTLRNLFAGIADLSRLPG